MAAHAAKNGGPVVPPTPLANPGPHRRDGYDLTLWTYVASGSETASAETVGEALARLHLCLRDYAGPLPDRLPVHAQIENGLRALEREAILDTDMIATLMALHDVLSLELAGVRGTHGVLHGDAHPWNLLRTEGRWLWIDIEETGFGPQEFDLAVLASKVQEVDAALSAYASPWGAPSCPRTLLPPSNESGGAPNGRVGTGDGVSGPERLPEYAQKQLDQLLYRDHPTG